MKTKLKKKQIVLRTLTGAVAFLGTAAGSYFLVPADKVYVKQNFNAVNQQTDDLTYFDRFIAKVKNIISEDEEESISGLEASINDLTISFPSKGLVDNNIVINGDLKLAMKSLNDFDLTVKLDTNYNGKNLNLGVGIVDKSLYLNVKDLKIKSTYENSVDALRYCYDLFINQENENGLRFDLKAGEIIDKFISTFDISKLLSGGLPTITETTSENNARVASDEVKINILMNGDSMNVDVDICVTKESLDLKYVNINSLSFGDVTIGGSLTASVKPNLVIPTLETYEGEYVEVISYLPWADKLLNFLQTRKTALDLSAEITLDGDTNTAEPVKLLGIEANANIDVSKFFNLQDMVYDTTGLHEKVTEEVTNEENSEVAENSEEVTTPSTLEKILNNLAFDFNVSISGQQDSEYANLALAYFDQAGYLSLNEREDNSAVMRAKMQTSMMQNIINKLPPLIEKIKANIASRAEATDTPKEGLFDFITSSELVTAIKEGRYDGILDVLETLRNNEKTIELGLNLSSLGLGSNAKVNLVLDAESSHKVLNLDVTGVEIGKANLSLHLNTNDYSDATINKISSSKDAFFELDFIPGVIDQVSTIADTERAYIDLNGSVKDASNLGVNFGGWLQFDAKNKYGFGSLDIDQLKENNKTTRHSIDIHVDNSAELASNRNIYFQYGPNDEMKGKLTVQTILDIVDLVKQLVGEKDERFTKFLEPIMETMGSGLLSSLINDQDYLALAKPSFLKEISYIDNKLNVVIAGDTLGMDSDIKISIIFELDNEGEKELSALEIKDLVMGEKTINFRANLRNFNDTKDSPVNLTNDFMDFSHIKVLLEFGIYTTKMNYYHLTGKVHLSAVSIINHDLNLDFHVLITGKETKVYGRVTGIPNLGRIFTNDWSLLGLGATIEYADFVFEPYGADSGDAIGGYFHILRREDHTLAKDENVYYKTTSKNFLDNILEYIAIDMLNFNQTFIDRIGGSISLSSDQEPEFYNLFNKNGFSYNANSLTWNIGLNMTALLHSDAIKSLDITLVGKEVDGKGYYSSITISTSISSLLTVNANISLANAGDLTTTGWSTNGAEARYNAITGIYNNMSVSQKANFDANYLNQPLKEYQA